MITFSGWFQTGPIPANAFDGEYNFTLVGLSYVIAVLASYVALNLVGRLRSENNSLAKVYWLAGGAFAMGAGIWSMHFIGMLAFILPMPMAYEPGWTLASLLMAIVASAFALFILQKHYLSVVQLAMGGIIIGLAISTMHYMGMQGMKSHLNIHYVEGLFFISIIIGIVASEAALYLSLMSNQGSQIRQFKLKIISALVMGIAICGMHYTGMAAAVFTPNPNHVMPVGENSIPPEYLAFFVAGITALITGLALTASISYKRMINAVENERNFLKAMLDNLKDGIIACDANAQITVVNKSLQKYIHAHPEQLNLENIKTYFNIFDTNNKALGKEEMPISKVLTTGESIQDMELIVKFKNNVVREVVVDAQNIVSSEGKTLGAVAVIHDITELKQTEKLKKEFVSIVSHELRTPLTSIRGSLGLLVSGVLGEFSEKVNKLLEIANNNCERLLLLINDILDVEKIEAGKMDFQIKSYDLNQLIEESITGNKMYAEKLGVVLKYKQGIKNINVQVDSGRFIQVMSNLISNACKFSPTGESVIVSAIQMNDKVRVTVKDNGPGISKEFQSRIFQKFSQEDSSDTRGKGGTGLGLNISKCIIEKLGGTLSFDSEAGKGASFYFDLPIAQEISKDVKKQVDIDFKRRLLICEDDHDQSEYLKSLLESAGFTIDVADTVAMAKRLLAENIYQALLLDLILPDQDGIAFIRDLRSDEKTKDLHIIVISVIAQTGHSLLNGDAVSVVDWLDKPVDFNKLLLSINRVKKKNNIGLPTILHIEDNSDIQHVVGTLLENHASLSVANNLFQAKELLETHEFDLIILDLVLPDGNGIDILPLLASYRAPVLVFSDMELNEAYAKFVSQALIKSSSSTEVLLNTIRSLI